jgi:transposase-like protein
VVQEGVGGEVERGELRGALGRLGLQRLVQELREGEQRDFLGGERDERGQARRAQRNGHETTPRETGEGRSAGDAPPVRSRSPSFESKPRVCLNGRTATAERLVSEMYAHGPSTRDSEAAVTDATGAGVVSKSALSEVTAQIWED